MNQIQLVQITPTELVSLISEGIKQQLKEFNYFTIETNQKREEHLTRKETAQFFDISLNCLIDWCRKGIVIPYKVGQRTYFKKSEIVDVLFNQPKRA
jgi:hypothetical protein